VRILVTGGAGFIGYAPGIPFRQGLEARVRWYADNRAWWEPLRRQGAAPAPAGSGRVS
jgi:dTDP-glucose 4,6-dehydratase